MWSKERREEKNFQAKGTTYVKTLKGNAEGAFDEHKEGQRTWSTEYNDEELPDTRP